MNINSEAVMVQDTLEAPLVWLTDFGLCEHMTEEYDQENFCPPPCYKAPELFDGKMHSEASDIWSFGALVYLILGGELPFEAEDPDELRDLMAEGPNFDQEIWE